MGSVGGGAGPAEASEASEAGAFLLCVVPFFGSGDQQCWVAGVGLGGGEGACESCDFLGLCLCRLNPNGRYLRVGCLDYVECLVPEFSVTDDDF